MNRMLTLLARTGIVRPVPAAVQLRQGNWTSHGAHPVGTIGCRRHRSGRQLADGTADPPGRIRAYGQTRSDHARAAARAAAVSLLTPGICQLRTGRLPGRRFHAHAMTGMTKTWRVPRPASAASRRAAR